MLLRLLLCCCVFLLAGCEQKKTFANVDITGAEYAQKLNLTDHHGKKRSLADFKGRAVLVFFGYTQCPDVCPTTMTEMAAIMKKLGSRAEQLQVIFVTLDPERDTQALLAQYVPAFDQRFLGMYGSLKETEEAAREFHIFFKKVMPKEGAHYTIDHTAGSYLFDKDGRVRLFIRYNQPQESILRDLEQLL
ncbi:SCO family protein [Massilia sp. W12]|uniref:SCO family protein n=1 Tax=Massilia sp. W12 TaxID=3126507 RepID=UPI0030D60368